jgi:hypothetical protein
MNEGNSKASITEFREQSVRMSGGPLPFLYMAALFRATYLQQVDNFFHSLNFTKVHHTTRCVKRIIVCYQGTPRINDRFIGCVEVEA